MEPLQRVHGAGGVDCRTETGPAPRHTRIQQIQLLVRTGSIQTTERYLGCKQKLRRPNFA